MRMTLDFPLAALLLATSAAGCAVSDAELAERVRRDEDLRAGSELARAQLQSDPKWSAIPLPPGAGVGNSWKAAGNLDGQPAFAYLGPFVEGDWRLRLLCCVFTREGKLQTVGNVGPIEPWHMPGGVTDALPVHLSFAFGTLMLCEPRLNEPPLLRLWKLEDGELKDWTWPIPVAAREGR